MENKVTLDGVEETIVEWRRLSVEVDRLTTKLKAIEDEMRLAMRTIGATIGTLRGVPIVSCRPTKTFRGAAFSKDRPDLVGQYTKTKTVEYIDAGALAEELPDVYAKYRTVSLRPDWKALDSVIGQQGNE